jgi:hypothetical protein
MNTNSFRDSILHTLTFLTVIALNASCGAPMPADHDASTAPPVRTRMERVDRCTETRCARAQRECREILQPFCDRCNVECYSLGASGDTCVRYCHEQCECDTHCSAESMSACGTTEYSFLLPANADAPLEAACHRALEHRAACNAPSIGGTCEVNARIERPENARAYNCVADITCGGKESECLTDLHPGTVGDELCSAIATACGDTRPCSDGAAEAFNREAAWLRDDSLAALRSCAPLSSCEDIWKCVHAWLVAAHLDE